MDWLSLLPISISFSEFLSRDLYISYLCRIEVSCLSVYFSNSILFSKELLLLLLLAFGYFPDFGLFSTLCSSWLIFCLRKIFSTLSFWFCSWNFRMLFCFSWCNSRILCSKILFFLTKSFSSWFLSILIWELMTGVFSFKTMDFWGEWWWMVITFEKEFYLECLWMGACFKVNLLGSG